ncbi:MAG: hypothetical protein AAGG38_11430 [Planctomycetota bacterium]
MIAANHPPTTAAAFLLRSASVLVVAACGWGLWIITQQIAEDFGSLNYWHLAYLIPVTFLAGMTFVFYHGVKSPTKTHLALLVAAATFVGWTYLVLAVEKFVEWMFVPSVVERLEMLLIFPLLIPAVTLGIFVHWKLAKKSGFIRPSRLWWSEDRLRQYFTFVAWVVFFSWSGTLGSDVNIFRVDHLGYSHGRESVVFLSFIVFCFALGLVIPRLLIALTGITPTPRAQRQRRQRRLRSFRRQTNP